MPPPLQIIKETTHWLLVNKTAGINVEQLWDYPSMEQEVKAYLQKKNAREPYLGIVHRLDRPVSGTLLFAKKKSTLKALNHQFATRTVRKVYWAICEGVPDQTTGVLEHYLLKDQKNKRAIAFKEERKGTTKAQLSYRLLGSAASGRLSCLEIRPISGRFHQIRVQLAAMGWPIVGDEKYGSQEPDQPNTIALHARQLSFTDPTSEENCTGISALPDRPIWQQWNASDIK